MNHLLAKTRGRNGTIYKVISDTVTFTLPEGLENSVDYSPDTLLEDEEWFKIENFSEQDYCIDFVKERFTSIEFDQIAIENYHNIEYLVSYQTGTYYFQKLSTKQLIEKKYFSLSDEPVLIEDEPIIVINELADAIYAKRADILYFKKLTSISTIFKGIDVLYREATEEETEEFLGQNFILLINDFNTENVKKLNRKRIAKAMETLATFSQEDRTNIFAYIREYCDNLEFNEEDANFSISNEEDLKKLLWGIEQRYYTTQLGNERRIANSIIPL